MRVNFDSKALRDKRFKRVALRTRLPLPHVYGACLMVWHECYSNRTSIMSIQDVDAFAELDGFAEALVDAELADVLGNGSVHVRGVEERISYLKGQSERSRKGVQARQSKQGDHDQSVDQTVNQGVNQTVNQPVQNEPMGQPLGEPNGQPSGISDLSGSQISTTRARSTGVARRVWLVYLKAFNEVRPAGVPELRDRPGADGERSIAALLPSLLAECNGDSQAAEAIMLHAIEVLKREAADSDSVQWFGEAMWTPKRFGEARVRQVGGETKRPAANQNSNPPARKFRVL